MGFRRPHKETITEWVEKDNHARNCGVLQTALGYKHTKEQALGMALRKKNPFDPIGNPVLLRRP